MGLVERVRVFVADARDRFVSECCNAIVAARALGQRNELVPRRRRSECESERDDAVIVKLQTNGARHAVDFGLSEVGDERWNRKLQIRRRVAAQRKGGGGTRL